MNVWFEEKEKKNARDEREREGGIKKSFGESRGRDDDGKMNLHRREMF